MPQRQTGTHSGATSPVDALMSAADRYAEAQAQGPGPAGSLVAFSALVASRRGDLLEHVNAITQQNAQMKEEIDRLRGQLLDRDQTIARALDALKVVRKTQEVEHAELQALRQWQELHWRAFEMVTNALAKHDLLQINHEGGPLAAAQNVVESLDAMTQNMEFFGKGNPVEVRFAAAIHKEAITQRERWGAQEDIEKTNADWLWLVGYLASKAVHPAVPEHKRLEYIVSAAAACMNWHGRLCGSYQPAPALATPL